MKQHVFEKLYPRDYRAVIRAQLAELAQKVQQVFDHAEPATQLRAVNTARASA